MFSSALLTSVLLATSALAVPSRLAQRVASRRSGTRATRPLEHLEVATHAATNNVSHVEYSGNWAGAVYDSYPAVCGHRVSECSLQAHMQVP